ncbi:MAG: hypothetical protein WBB73_08765 [Candidatus Aminicenantaceae bacterium]
MKKLLPILLILCFGLIFCSSGEQGVTGAGMADLVPTQFSELGFTAVLALAKQENKHVLVDFFSPT